NVRRRRRLTCALTQPRFQLVRTDAVVVLEGLVYPGVRRQFLNEVIGGCLRMPLPPQHGGAQFLDAGKLLHEVIANAIEGEPGVDHVVDQQHLAVERAARDGDELRNVELPLHRTGRLAVTAGGQYAEGHVVDARQNIAHAYATPG